MSTLTISLEKYTKAKEAIQSHIESNDAVFKSHEQLVGKLIDAENDLRDVVQLEKQNVENDVIKVTYSPVFRKYYDGDVVMLKATVKMKQELLESRALSYTIDREIFEELVNKGIVPIELKQEAYREEEKNPRISIREVRTRE